MSEYTLTQRVIITADETDAAGVSPKTVALASPVKPASAFITSTVRDVRKNVFVQRGIESIVNPNTTPRNVAISAVVLAASHVKVSAHQIQTGTAIDVRARLTTTTNLELVFTNPGAGDSIEVAWEVIQHMQPRGATLRLVDANNVELAWDGTLVAGEQIVASVDVFDLEDLGDDIKEILFRQVRLLGYNGENAIQDLITFDTQGNMLTYRVRVFDSKTNLDASTPNETGALVVGELARITFTQTIKVAKNDRTLSTEVLTDIADNPDIT